MKLSSANYSFANIEGVRQDKVVAANLRDGVLHLRSQNAIDPKDEDAYVMTLKGDQAKLGFDNLPPGVLTQPLALQRAAATAKVAADWERNRLYVAGDSDTPNAEMKAIYQRVRTTDNIDWTIVNRSKIRARALPN
ncbi:MAG: hypothetical protein ACLQLC_18470 [Candidatus Sulfotelmatobacter sp.]